MTDNRYEQFLDEFGARLRQAAASSREVAASPRLGIFADALTLVCHSTRVRIGAASALCVAGTAVLLLLIAPWGGSPSYLARAAAAIAAPGPDAVLYESWEVTRSPSPRNQGRRIFGPNQLWTEGAAPRRYRLIMPPNTKSPTIWGEYASPYYGFGGYTYWMIKLTKAVAGHPLEIGGEWENPAELGARARTLTFTPPDTLWRGRFRPSTGVPLTEGSNNEASNPVSVLREEIAKGSAREDGTSKLDGQTVKRIAFNAGRGYALVNSKTFKPVVIAFPGVYFRFLAYEYLPANPANLALANIQTQHPNAKVIADTRPSNLPPVTFHFKSNSERQEHERQELKELQKLQEVEKEPLASYLEGRR
jgi:hypothetical protein